MMKNTGQWLYQYLTVLFQWDWTQHIKGNNSLTSPLDTVSTITRMVKKDIKKLGAAQQL